MVLGSLFLKRRTYLLECVYLSLSLSVSPFLFSTKLELIPFHDWWKVICSASFDRIVQDYGNHLYNFNAFSQIGNIAPKYFKILRKVGKLKECDRDWQTDIRGCDRDVINLDFSSPSFLSLFTRKKIFPFFSPNLNKLWVNFISTFL